MLLTDVLIPGRELLARSDLLLDAVRATAGSRLPPALGVVSNAQCARLPRETHRVAFMGQVGLPHLETLLVLLETASRVRLRLGGSRRHHAGHDRWFAGARSSCGRRGPGRHCIGPRTRLRRKGFRGHHGGDLASRLRNSFPSPTRCGPCTQRM